MNSKSKEWRFNTYKYLLGLHLIEKSYEENKINKKQKREIEERLTFLFKKNYWKLNPNLDNPLFLTLLPETFFLNGMKGTALSYWIEIN